MGIAHIFSIEASVEVYLLEKVRLITQALGERNYHVFYEILAGADPEDKKKYFLNGLDAHDFLMTSASGTFDRRDGVQDSESYHDLRKGKLALSKQVPFSILSNFYSYE